MLEVITALAAEETHSESTHSRAASSSWDAQGTPTQSAALQGTAHTQGTAETQGTEGTAEAQDASQTSGGDEGLLDLYALNREVRRLKKQTISQAKQIHKLKAKLKKLSIVVKPLVKHNILWVKSQKLKKRETKKKKKVSSVKLGRNKDEDEDVFVTVTPDLERKSDETEQVTIEEEKDASDVKSGDTEELDLEEIQSKGILVEEPKKKKLTLQQIRALETTNDEEVARKVQAEWDAKEERKRLEDLKKPKPKTISKKPTQERNQ
ncbi:hypothetical protein Tco_0029607, partial [Tanacetum coccineum]